MRIRLCLLALGCLAAPVRAETLRVCLNDVAHAPWRLPDDRGRARREGLDFVFLELLQQRSGVRVEIALLPWKRCLADIKTNQQDAILGISYLPEREELGHYPQLAGQPDESLAVRYDQYAWYAPAGTTLRWDGKQLAGLAPESIVGVQSGYSIASLVRGMNLRVDEAARTAEANLEKLARGRVQIAALQSREADQVLAAKPALAAAVHRLDPKLQERAYFMIFSREFVARSKRALPLWWREVVAVRDSAAYRKAEADALRALQESP